MLNLITPQTLNVAFAMIAGEALFGTWLLNRFRRPQLILPLLLFLISGALLMLGLRLALATPDSAQLIGLCLTGALITHIACLAALWQALKSD